ncbi:MAG: hypothetical protein J5666_05065, partial [Bacilli bacterium]|nr:hypothetical protein [Bacilli bacterium]
MDECFKDAADEQLVLLVYKNLVPAYYELFDRCRFYIKKCASDVQSLYKPINYDEGEINLCFTRAFKESINTFNFKQSFFKNYFIRLFRRYYVAEVKERAEKEQKEYSLEEYLSPEADTKYNDVIDDGRDYYQEFYDLVTKKEILSKLKTTLD